MSELDALRPTLNAIAPARVVEPSLPMAVVLQEANDLHHQLQRDDTWSRMLGVGADPAALEGLRVAVAATRRAQSQWVAVRDRRKAAAQHEREHAGAELRAELVAACRWNLRSNPRALAILGEIVKGNSVADLIQDLTSLAALIDHHPADFIDDDTFDATVQAETARSMAEELAAGLSSAKVEIDRDTAKALRDRAFTHLASLVKELREAGRYAFRKEPNRAAAFGSEHQRKIHARARRRAALRTTATADATTSATATRPDA